MYYDHEVAISKSFNNWYATQYLGHTCVCLSWHISTTQGVIIEIIPRSVETLTVVRLYTIRRYKLVGLKGVIWFQSSRWYELNALALLPTILSCHSESHWLWKSFWSQPDSPNLPTQLKSMISESVSHFGLATLNFLPTYPPPNQQESHVKVGGGWAFITRHNHLSRWGLTTS